MVNREVQMGTAISRRPSFKRKGNPEIVLNQKEYIFLVLQTEIDYIIENKNNIQLHQCELEIGSIINELNTFLNINKYGRDISERAQRLIHNYEISLAKVRSIFNTIPKRKANNNRHITDVGRSIPDRTFASPLSTSKPIAINSGQSFLNIHNNKRKAEVSELMVDYSTSVPNIDGRQIHVNDDEPSMPYSSTLGTDTTYTDEPIYVNVESLDAIMNYRNTPPDNSASPKSKLPMPQPRNTTELLVKEIPSYLEKLNSILGKESLDSKDIEEVLLIRKNTNHIKDIFTDKMERIFKRYEDSFLS